MDDYLYGTLDRRCLLPGPIHHHAIHEPQPRQQAAAITTISNDPSQRVKHSNHEPQSSFLPVFPLPCVSPAPSTITHIHKLRILHLCEMYVRSSSCVCALRTFEAKALLGRDEMRRGNEMRFSQGFGVKACLSFLLLPPPRNRAVAFLFLRKVEVYYRRRLRRAGGSPCVSGNERRTKEREEESGSPCAFLLVHTCSINNHGSNWSEAD